MKKLFCLLFFISCLIMSKSAFSNEELSFFSGNLVGSNFLTFVISGDRVFVRKLNNNTQVDKVEQKTDGSAIIIREPNNNINVMQNVWDKNSVYEYYIPENGCYLLDNFYKVCVKDGKIVTLLRYSGKISSGSDKFFNEKSKECNIFKFNIIYYIFILQKDTYTHQYQVAFNGYPDFIKAIIIDYDQMIKNKTIKSFKNIDGLKIFFVSSKNDVGCIPFKKMKLYSIGEAQLYKMHIPQYYLIGPVFNENKDDKSFIEIDRSKITKYNQEMIKHDDNNNSNA